MTGAQSSPASAVIVDGQAYGLGGSVAIDGRISWIARSASGYAPINCYLLKDEQTAMLIDTGLPVHEDVVVQQIRGLLSAETRLSIFHTRLAEFDSIGNSTAIARAFPTSVVYGHRDGESFLEFHPKFDVSSLSTTRPSRSPKIDYRVIKNGTTIELGDRDHGRRILDVIHAPLRLLATSWLYDRSTRTLFTSDAFGHVVMEKATGARVVDGSTDTTTADVVREHLFTKFDWLRAADTTQLRDELGQIFEMREIDVIAPTHGCILKGRDVVARHYEMMQAALASATGVD